MSALLFCDACDDNYLLPENYSRWPHTFSVKVMRCSYQHSPESYNDHIYNQEKKKTAPICAAVFF